MKVIDVSKHNGDKIDWKKVKAAGVYGVIIRAGYGRYISQKDKFFEQNYAGAVAAGLHVGSYWYSYADSPADAKLEAQVFLEAIKDKKFDLPVYFDIEEPKHSKMSKTICTAMCDAFCSTMEKAGYFCGVYSYDSFFTTNLYPTITQKYSQWVARIGSKPTNEYDMWQYTWTDTIDGISGKVDSNRCYKTFPDIIKKAGLNGYGNKSVTYKIEAVKAGLNSAEADKLASELSKNGMTVVKKEEN